VKAELQIVEVSEVDLAREFVRSATEFQIDGDTLTVFVKERGAPTEWLSFSFDVGREVAEELICQAG
jgi:hypothetical protein